MRAAVAQARHRMRIAQHLAGGIEIAVGIIQERHIEHAAALIRQHRVIGQFFRLPALAAGLRAQGIFRRLFVVRRIAEQIHLVVVRPEEQRIVGRRRVFAQDRRAHLGLMQPRQPLGQRQLGDRLVARMGLERVARQFQSEHQPDRARGDLRGDRQAAVRSLVDGVERLAPALRRLVVLRDRERDRASWCFPPPAASSAGLHGWSTDRARIAARCGRRHASRRRSRSVRPRRPSASA